MYLNALAEIGESYEEEKTMNFVLSCWAKAPCVLLIDDEEIIGFAGLNTQTKAYNSEVYLREYMFYILHEFRGIKSWRTLCKGVQAVSDRFGLPFVGEHRIQGNLKNHQRLIKMAGAVPKAILSVYGENNGR